jgi:hypothetical protein
LIVGTMTQQLLQRVLCLLLASLLLPIETCGWSFPKLGAPPKTTKTSSPVAVVTDKDLSPPWSFEASRIYYQFRLVPTEQAAKYCPTTGEDGVFLFNVFGVTLGGIFCVEYTSTPIGPYREVAFLAGLVGRRSGIGAWASHILVDSKDAALYGEQFWGLPAKVLPIDLSLEEERRCSDSTTDVFLSEERVQVSGWKKTLQEMGDTASTFTWLDLTLPSFSGRLRDDSTTGEPSPLLRYPLRIQSPKSISLVDNGDIRVEGNGKIQTELQELISKSVPLVSLQIDEVQLTAGVATVESN